MDVDPANLVVQACDLQPNPLDGMHRLQPLRADLGAIHDGSTAKKPVRIVVKILKPLLCGSVPAVEYEAVCLDKSGGPNEFFGQSMRRIPNGIKAQRARAARVHEAAVRVPRLSTGHAVERSANPRWGI